MLKLVNTWVVFLIMAVYGSSAFSESQTFKVSKIKKIVANSNGLSFLIVRQETWGVETELKYPVRRKICEKAIWTKFRDPSRFRLELTVIDDEIYNCAIFPR